MPTIRSHLPVVPWALFALLVLSIHVPRARAEDKPTTATERLIRVVVWDEQQPKQKTAYDNFLGNAIAEYLKSKLGLTVKSVKMDDPEQGLPDALLNDTDVLIWWGHVRHTEVKEELGKKVAERVKAGKLALIALHSAHWSQPFVQAMYERTKQDVLAQIPADRRDKVKVEYVTPPRRAPVRGGQLTPKITKSQEPDGTEKWTVVLPLCVFPAWREDGAPSHVTTLMPDHPIAAGIPKQFDLPHTEMYDEPFHVPAPDAVIFEEHWDKGEHFRSGCLWEVGKGKVFYFRPGHETFPIYREEMPLKIVENATRWLGAQLPPATAEKDGQAR